MKFLVCFILALLAVAAAEDSKKQKRGVVGLGYSGVAFDTVPVVPVYSAHVVSSPIVTKTYAAPVVSTHYVAHSAPIVQAPVITKAYVATPVISKTYAGPIVSTLGHGLTYSSL